MSFSPSTLGFAPPAAPIPPLSRFKNEMNFLPDSSVVSGVTPSANFDARKDSRAPDMIVLHYTGMADAASAIVRLCTAGTEISAHYVVLEDGSIMQCVKEEARAWHAGTSSWGGETDINSSSIGIEIVNGGHDLGYPDFPIRQIAAVIALCKGITLRRQIPKHRVLAHSDVAPARKKDPGEKFPWRLLADSGVGHWVEPAPIVRSEHKMLGATGEQVLSLQRGLANYGYGVLPSGQYDGATMDAIAAFQRHFRPERVDGIADHSTLATLQNLLETLPKEISFA
ncbi:MAG: N-acetylmuramoyl-L-alanine amidase [Xanthobacteraceae bacterium]|nr:N-acetylmuramoyl-L-alanine amidase [Xanthobacteraceae bacterium]